jgi:hypothetical protein
VTADGPDVVALQEIPVWGLARLEGWSGMQAFGAVAMRSILGPAARRLTDLDPRRLRSAVTGQANALLVDRSIDAVGRGWFAINPASLRRAVATDLGLPRGVRAYWARNRRVCHSILIGGDILVANLHATTHPDRRLAEAELSLVADRLRGDGPAAVCGDFNLEHARVDGFSNGSHGIDQIVVRNLRVERGAEPWPEERRRVGGVLLSDHAPIEAVVAST